MGEEEEEEDLEADRQNAKFRHSLADLLDMQQANDHF